MKILFATDGSEASGAAAKLLMASAQPSDSEITILSVADSLPMFPETYILAPDLTEKVRAASQAVVDRTVAGFEEQGFTVQGEVVEGLPGRSIVERAREGMFDLVVVGAGSHSWLGHILLGSVSTCVLHNSPVSVLVVHEPPRTEGKLKVLVATDGSGAAGAAVSDFASLVDPSRCEVTVVSVAKIPYTMAGGYPYPSMVGLDPALVGDYTEKAKEKADRMGEVLRRAGFQTETVATDGSPHHLVLEEADKGGFDLVVVGSRGHGPVLRGILGSVSDAAARHAHATLVGRTNRPE
ncbi:MAG TPA: universal stress protein [Actinomycetota bacterium]|jgi:nucleotide-binding universal stress UspA family protein|nr:universal stress protein [Actinomycetota bacterium]